MILTMPHYLTAPDAAKLLRSELGKTNQYWERYLRANKGRSKGGSAPTIPFEVSNGSVLYTEQSLFQFIYRLRPKSLSKAKRRKERPQFWCSAMLQPSYQRGGELGVALSMPGPHPARTWLSRAQMIHLAHELLISARYIVGRSVNCESDSIVADSEAVLMTDERFEFLQLLYSTSLPAECDFELEMVLESIVTPAEIERLEEEAHEPA